MALKSGDSGSGNEGTGRKGRFSFPRLGRKTNTADKVEGSNFSLGSGSPDDPNNPFSNSFKIEDNIGPIPSEKEMKKSKRGKSNLTLGAKYGGRRRIFAAMAAAFLLMVLAVPTMFLLINSKMSKSEAQSVIETAVQDTTARTFPVGTAGMWVESFVRVYGTWDYKTPGARAADLSPFLAPGMNPQAGWDGRGQQRLIYSAVSSQPEVIDRQRAVFDVTYQIQDGTWRCAKVPVFAFKPTDSRQGPVDQWGFAVTANPTPMPCALRVSVPGFAPNRFGATDTNAATTLRDTFFPGFFTAWVASDADTLRQYMGPDIKTFGLGGAYQSNPVIDQVTLPVAEGESIASPNTVYTAYVGVTLTDFGGAQLKVTYKVPVASNGSQWQVMGEPDAIIQGLEGSGGAFGESEGKDVSGTGDDALNEYSEPDQPQPGQPAEQQPSVPAVEGEEDAEAPVEDETTATETP